jgi:F0F1-type ATP synthase alpha subunit
MREKYPDIGEKIRREQRLDADTEADLRRAVEEYKARFKEEQGLS